MKDMKVAAFLPAKGNSERIINKNMKLLDKKPLFMYMLETLCDCDFIDEVYLDSDSDEILSYAPYLNYIPFKRDALYATNKTDGHSLFYNEVSKVSVDIYIQALGTSPFIKKETIKKGIDVLINNSQYDSVVLVRKEKQYLWNGGRPAYDRDNIPNSVDLPDTVVEAMALYIVRAERALSEKKRYGKNVYLLEAEAIETVDINFPQDFELAENIARGMRTKEATYFKFLSTMLNSAIFSDILDDLRIGGVISGLKPNDAGARILARANTLKLRAVNDERDDYRKIYDALKTYEKIGEGEVIVVENEVSDKAYFGELNANLAMRSGAIGAIIGGVTRDASEVRKLGLPVFSSGYCCSDVRGRAVMESHNQPISIENISVAPGDLVFADVNGIAVIPRKYENLVLEKALAVASREKSILNVIAKNMNAYDVLLEKGEF